MDCMVKPRKAALVDEWLNHGPVTCCLDSTRADVRGFDACERFDLEIVPEDPAEMTIETTGLVGVDFFVPWEAVWSIAGKRAAEVFREDMPETVRLEFDRTEASRRNKRERPVKLSLEPGDTVIVRTKVQRILQPYDAIDPGTPFTFWQFTATVRHVCDRYILCDAPAIEDPLRDAGWFLDPCDIAWIVGDPQAPNAAPKREPNPNPEHLPPGSYGDHKDPRAAMDRLLDERERITGKRLRLRKSPAALLRQLDEWFDAPSWQKLCPPGHWLGRHEGNFLDIGVWPGDDRA